jgi:DNA topoisomerase-1
LGSDDAGNEISLLSGRFGPYVQRGVATDENLKPERASLPKSWSAADLDLERALMLLNLPRPVGPHPEDGVLIEAGLGRFGPYLKHGTVYANLKDIEEVFTIGMNHAVQVLAEKKAAPGRGRTVAAPLKELGEHPEKGGPLQVMAGRYGAYVKWDKVNATLPKELTPEAITLEEAVGLVDAKAGKGKPAKAKAAPKKSAAKKPAAKKKAASKKASAKAAKSDGDIDLIE